MTFELGTLKMGRKINFINQNKLYYIALHSILHIFTHRSSAYNENNIPIDTTNNDNPIQRKSLGKLRNGVLKKIFSII